MRDKSGLERRKYHTSDLSKIKFLVTGGAGFIGSSLVEYLLHFGAQVRVVDDFSNGFRKNIKPFLENPNFEFIEGDIRDINTCQKGSKGVDYILNSSSYLFIFRW